MREQVNHIFARMNMTRMRLRLFFPIAAAFALTLGGCLDLERMTLRYQIEGNLGGRLSIMVHGVHSTEKDAGKREKEFREFVEKGYLKDGDEMARKFGLVRSKVVLMNTTESRTDVRLEGDFEQLVSALGPLTGEGDFEIGKKGGRLSVVIRRTPEKPWSDIPAVLILRYEGEILGHNAHRYEEGSKTLTWDLRKMKGGNLEFVLALPE